MLSGSLNRTGASRSPKCSALRPKPKPSQYFKDNISIYSPIPLPITDAEQLTDHSDDQEMLLDDAQKDSQRNKKKRSFRIYWQSEFTWLEKSSNNEGLGYH
uniref:Uncharacterized protein n=1 Tax=Romanomermis culicivorax TaxID=13658 RepID=A0A915JZ54_ROMCU